MSNSFYNAHIFVCTNYREPGHKRGCCGGAGSEALRDYMKKRVKELKLPRTRVNVAGCLDRCELGPVMVIYPEGAWYHVKTEADVDEILTSHVMNGKPVERLLLRDDQRALDDHQQ